MDPVTMMLIGSAMAGGGSLLGGLFGSEATSSANAANIAQAQWQSTGGYLPGLVRNAEAAGINPLAVLPGGGGSANIMPVAGVGSGLADAMKGFGQNITRAQAAISPHDEKMQALQERSLQADIDLKNAEAARAAIHPRVDIGAPGTPDASRADQKEPWPMDLAKALDKSAGIADTLNTWSRNLNEWAGGPWHMFDNY